MFRRTAAAAMIAIATLGLGLITEVKPAAAQSIELHFGERYRPVYRDYYDGPRYYRGGPYYRPVPPPWARPHYYRDEYRPRRRNCEPVRVRFWDGYGWRGRTEMRCSRW